jgi:hypothetical protein
VEGQVQKQHILHNMLIHNYYSNDKHLPYLCNTKDTENNLGISYSAFVAVVTSLQHTFTARRVFHALLIDVTVYNGATPNTEHHPVPCS